MLKTNSFRRFHFEVFSRTVQQGLLSLLAVSLLGCVAPAASDPESDPGYGAADGLPQAFLGAEFGGYLLVSPSPTNEYFVPDTEAPAAVMRFSTPDNATVSVEVSGVESVLLQKFVARNEGRDTDGLGTWIDVPGGEQTAVSGTWSKTFGLPGSPNPGLSGLHRLVVTRQTREADNTQIRIFDPRGTATSTPYCVFGNSMLGRNAAPREGFVYNEHFLGDTNPARASGLYLSFRDGWNSRVPETVDSTRLNAWRTMSALSVALAQLPEGGRRGLNANPLGGNFYASGDTVMQAIQLIEQAVGANNRDSREYMITTMSHTTTTNGTTTSTAYVAHQMLQNRAFAGIEGDGFVFRNDNRVPRANEDDRAPVYRLDGNTFVGCAP